MIKTKLKKREDFIEQLIDHLNHVLPSHLILKSLTSNIEKVSIYK